MRFLCPAAFDLVENFHLGMGVGRGEILKTKRCVSVCVKSFDEKYIQEWVRGGDRKSY